MSLVISEISRNRRDQSCMSMSVEASPSAVSAISSETFRKIVLEIADGVIGVDRQGMIRLANPAAAQIFGWGEGELLGKPLSVLLPERVQAVHEGMVNAFKAGGVETRRMGQRGSGIVGRKADGSEVNLGIT